MGSAGAGESSDEGNWFPLGFSPSALPSVILAGRDGRMDGGAPATPGPAWGEEPWEGAGLPEPRLMLPPAWGHVTAWPAPPRRPVRTAPLQLRTASVQQMDGSSPSSLRLQLMDGSGSILLLFLVAPAHLHLQFWLQLVCGSCLFLLWFQSSRWTAPAPAHCGSSSWMALAHSSPSSLWLQLICTFGFGCSSFAAPVCFCSGFSPAHGRLQLDSSSFGLQLMDGSGSFQPLFLVAAAHLHLQVQLLVGSSWVSSPGQFWLQPIDGSSSFSPPALGWFQLWLQPQPITACACSTAPGFWPGCKSITVMACI
ncbi:uncharacterized protein LOC134516529 isoform X2 [Chroicocephalus ridibundus]|uniref:uncharacterized protein LOC134516529 isoform X2 n=1 Tax=Chroicocephalus ridibundus TaxID=1192867 RepID=UPI002FDD34F5